MWANSKQIRLGDSNLNIAWDLMLGDSYFQSVANIFVAIFRRRE